MSTAHKSAVAAFLAWFRGKHPAVAAKVASARPDLVQAGAVVDSGALAITANSLTFGQRFGAGPNGLSGLADAQDATATPDTSSGLQTAWGTDFISTVKAVVPAYFQYKTQNDLIAVNIARAEKGLPPIDSAALAPSVNVGMTPATQQLVYIGLGGAMILGVLHLMKKRAI